MIRPLGRRVLVRPDTDEEKTASGLIIPEQAKNPLYLMGIVEAVGTRVELDVKAGDRVLFDKVYSEIQDNKETKYLVEDVFLIAIAE